MRSWEGYFVLDALKLVAFAIGSVLGLWAACWLLATLTFLAMRVFGL